MAKQLLIEHSLFHPITSLHEGIKNRFGDKGLIINDKILGPGHYLSDQYYSIEKKYGEKSYI